MSKHWIKEVFGTMKPIIAMCHLNALPGDPDYDSNAGMKNVVDWARKDLLALQNGGVDSIMFSNEFSIPYLTKVEPITIAAMGRVIGEILSDINIPFGVNVLWDPIRSLDLASATGAKYIREVISGVYASDFGLWDTNAGATARHKHTVNAENVKLLYNIVPEAAVYLEERDIVEVAKSTVFNHRPDALCVSGLTAGIEADTSILKAVKQAVPETIVFANTGVKLENVEEQLKYADGAIVGTTFKYNGQFDNHVDEGRVKEFMEKVRRFRQ